MIYGSVCSGIEAATVAWHPLGWTPAFFAEIDPFASKVLEYHYPQTPNLGDMTRFKDWPDYAIDVLVGGTPCQGFSVAGLRGGLDDPRSNLMLTFGAIAAKYRSPWLVWENVPGVLSSDGGRDFAQLLGLLTGQRIEVPEKGWRNSGIVASISSAYGLAWRVLDAQFVRVESHPRAVPQRRRRVFVVGHLGDWRRAAAVLFERESLCGHPPPRREAWKVATGTLAARTKGGGGLGTDFDLGGGLTAVPEVCETLSDGAHMGGGLNGQDAHTGRILAVEVEAGVARTLLGKANSSHAEDYETYVAHSLTGEGFDACSVDGCQKPRHSGGMCGTGRATPIVAQTVTADMYRSGGAVAGNNDQGVRNCIVAPCAGPIPYNVQSQNSCAMKGCGNALAANPAEVARALDSAGFTTQQGGTVVAFSCKDHGSDAGEVAPTLRSMGHDGSHANGGGQVAVAFQTRIARNGRGQPEEVCPALNGSDAGETSDMRPCVATRSAVRRLTPRECERLQGFPDNFTDIPLKTRKSGKVNFAKDGPRYKSLGNSMATNCMRWIGDRIVLCNTIPKA